MQLQLQVPALAHESDLGRVWRGCGWAASQVMWRVGNPRLHICVNQLLHLLVLDKNSSYKHSTALELTQACFSLPCPYPGSSATHAHQGQCASLGPAFCAQAAPDTSSSRCNAEVTALIARCRHPCCMCSCGRRQAAGSSRLVSAQALQAAPNAASRALRPTSTSRAQPKLTGFILGS